MPLHAGTAPEDIRYFDELGDAMRKRLPASADAADELVASFAEIGLSVGNGFAWKTLDDPTKRGLARAAKIGEQIVDAKWAAAGEITNGWKYTFAGGRAGYDPGLRAALAKYELGAQLSDQVLYPNTSVDDKGEQLTGERKYVLHFDAGKLPPVSVFWNMAMYRVRHAICGEQLRTLLHWQHHGWVEAKRRRVARHRNPERAPRRYIQLATCAFWQVQPHTEALWTTNTNPGRHLSATGSAACSLRPGWVDRFSLLSAHLRLCLGQPLGELRHGCP